MSSPAGQQRRRSTVRLIAASAIVGSALIGLASCRSPDGASDERTTSAPSTEQTEHAAHQASQDTTPVPPTSVDPIPSNFAVAAHVVVDENGTPESSADEPSGSFRFLCDFSHVAYDDPIVYPEQPGAAHLHMFFGNDRADASSTYSSLRETGDSTCQGGPVNRSAYWAPAVFDADGDVVRPEYISVYYKGPGTARDGSIVDVEALPPGLRMIAGQDLEDPVESSPHDWYCERDQIKSDRIPDCSPDELVGVSLAFPACWNGTELDAADHRSHMAYEEIDPDTGISSCPASHPVRLPEFTLGIWFEHDGDSSNWYLSSDRAGENVWDNGASFHSDWFGAWDPTIQDVWTDSCINGLLNCSGGQLGDGTQLAGLPDYTGPTRLSPPTRDEGS